MGRGGRSGRGPGGAGFYKAAGKVRRGWGAPPGNGSGVPAAIPGKADANGPMTSPKGARTQCG
eukprot:14906413-Alexandrium_andersonii.AAC.1